MNGCNTVTLQCKNAVGKIQILIKYLLYIVLKPSACISASYIYSHVLQLMYPGGDKSCAKNEAMQIAFWVLVIISIITMWKNHVVLTHQYFWL